MKSGKVCLFACLLICVCTVHGIALEKRVAMRAFNEIEYQFGGVIGKRIEANINNWIKRAPADNPGMLEMFERRDIKPPLHLLPWSGEFVGKYLISGILALRMSEDPELEKTLRQVVNGMIDLQTDDGYLGPFPQEQRLNGHCYWDPESLESHWDLWGHYNIMLALLLWNEYTGDQRALRTAVKAADLICNTFLDSEMEVIDAAFPNQNGAISHVLLLLHRKTGNERYLKLAEDILTDYKIAGDYIEKALQGADYYQIRAPGKMRDGGAHWEALHILQGVAEYYLISGREKYRKAFLHHWYSIHKTDIHNTGAFSTNERAVGNPYEEGYIETCCTVAWIHMTLDALRLAADTKMADTLEHALLNAMAGSQHPSGHWWTYNTPMEGRKHPSYVTINFQTRDASPELNCCSVNAPRSLGCLGEWALMQADNALVVNYFGPMEATLKLASGDSIRLIQETNYPIDGQVNLRIKGARGKPMPLWLRIPAWSQQASIKVNDKTAKHAVAGSYYKLTRKWKDTDRITLELDMPIRYLKGAMRFEDHVSIYRGPILLAFDPRFNPTIAESHPPDGWVIPWTEPMPPIDEVLISDATLMPQNAREYGAGLYRPWVLVNLPIAENNEVILCDFATAGFPGTSYRTWLETKN